VSVAALAATLLVAAGCGGSANGDPSAPAVQRVPRLMLLPGGKPMSWRIPPRWRITLQARFPGAHSTLRMGVGSSAVMVFDGSHVWHRVELRSRGLTVDGHASGGSGLRGTSVSLQAMHQPVDVRELVIRRGRS
jgi:hypothetical protein